MTIMKRFILFLLMLMFIVPTVDAGRHKSYYSPKQKTTRTYQKKSYKTPGVARDSRGRIKRSRGAVNEFLKQHGYKKVPKGYEVDHIVPLSEGGCDCPSNMQLLSKEEHRRKTNQMLRDHAKTRKR